jgi:cell division protein FtsN
MTAGSMNTPVTKRRPMIDMEEFERRLRQSSGNQTDDGPLAELARVISGQKEPVQRVAEPQSQSSTEARQEATSSPEAQNTEAEEPDALQSLDDDKMACRDSGAVNEKIPSRRSLCITIVAAIIVAGIIGLVASVGYRKSASPPPEIALLSEIGPTEPQQTNRSDVPTPDTSILGRAPQPSPTAVNNVEQQPVAPSRPRETVPAAEVAASPEQIETPVQPPSQTASIEPEKMNTASVEQHAAISSDMPPRAKPKVVPVPAPRPASLAKVPTPKTAARVTIGNTVKPKRPESAVRAQPMPTTSTTEKRGWVNFGTFKNGNWVEKQFEISGAPMRPPRPGDTLTATIPVNVRRGPIEGTKDFRWQNQPVACDPTNVGEKFTVIRTVEIVPGYFWAEIKNSVQCTK